MGAWTYISYKSVTRAYDDPRLGAALIAIKKEIVYNGYGEFFVVADTPVFGDAAANAVKKFQADKGLKVDGQVGPSTARELFRKRTEDIERRYDLIHGTLGNLITLESAWDPVAIGYADPDDHGLVQINLRIHSDVTVEQAYDPAFSINWAALYITDNEKIISNEVNIAKAARASYNVGVEYAKRWMKADFPTAGGLFDSTGIDWYRRASEYTSLIDRQTW